MTRNRQAPKLSAFLLHRLVPDQESLGGDLQEEFRAGRSRFWFWRQVVVAIVVSAWRGLRDQPLALLRSLVGAWVALTVIFYPGLYLLERVIGGGGMLPEFVIVNGPRWFVMFWLDYVRLIPHACLGCVAVGWVASRLNRSHPASTLFALLATVLLGPILLSTEGFVLKPFMMMGAGVTHIHGPLRFILWMRFLTPLLMLLSGGTLGARRRQISQFGEAS